MLRAVSKKKQKKTPRTGSARPKRDSWGRGAEDALYDDESDNGGSSGSDASSTELILAARELRDRRAFEGKVYHNNKAGMAQALQQLKDAAPWKSSGDAVQDWLETLDVSTAAPLEVEDIHDDFKRELAFQEQAMEGVKSCRARLTMAKVPFARPDDYFAEMLKTDAHMTRIKRKMLSEKESIEAGLQRRKQKDLKKYGKKVQMEKIRERHQAKKADEQALKKWRKERSGKGGPIEDDAKLPISFDHKKSSRKREKKDEQYGFGGRKRGRKVNDAESASNLSFSKTKNSQLPSSLRKTRSARGSINKAGPGKGRPGKARRMQSRNKQASKRR